MTARPVCAICLSEAPHALDLTPAQTTVGPLAVCSLHVDAALAKLGYAPSTLDIAGWLETVDPQELQNAAAELVDDYENGGIGKAYLKVLVEAAKEQAA